MSIYRKLNLPLHLLVAASIAVLVLTVAAPQPAFACSGGPIPLPAERFTPGNRPQDAIIGENDIVLLGSVKTETQIDEQFQKAYQSSVDVVVPLYGSMKTTVGVGPSGYGAPDCSGGPRLFPGEKVMLFLHPSRPLIGTNPAAGEQGEWQSGQFGTPILFDGDSAYYLGWSRFAAQGDSDQQDVRFYVGKSADVLRIVMQYFNPTPAEQEAAYRFVLGTSAPSVIPQGPSRIVPPAAGDAGLR